MSLLQIRRLVIIPADAQIVITQDELTPRAQNKVPNAYHVSVDNFLSSPEYDSLIASASG